MFKYLRMKISDCLFPYLHQRIIEKHAQEKKLARFMKQSKASHLGIDRRKLRDRRAKVTTNDVA